MNIDFSKPLLDLDQKEIPGGNLGSVCVNALLTPAQGDERMSGEEKLKRYKLGMKISGNDSADLSAEELSLIKACVGKLYAPLIVGRVYDAIDPVDGE